MEKIYRKNATVKESLESLLPLWKCYAIDIKIEDEEFASEEALKQRLMAAEQINKICFETLMDDEKIIGFVFYSIDGGIRNLIPAGYGYIMEIYVIPEYRNHKIASAVVKEIEAYYREKGCPKVYLTPSDESVVFWMRQGYEDSNLTDPDNKATIFWKTL